MEQGGQIETPKRLRGVAKKDGVGRRSVAERITPSGIDQDMRETASLLILSLRKDIKNMTAMEKISYLGKLLPCIKRDDYQSDEDVTFEIMTERFLKTKVQIKGVTKRRDTKEDDNE